MATRYWIKGTAGNWNDNSNWSTSSGGAGGASYPQSSDDAIFDSNGTGDCTLNGAVSIASLDVQSGYTGTIDTDSGNNYAITVSGNFTISGGNLTANGSTITCGADVAIADTSGLLTVGSSTFVLSGSGDLSNPNYGNRFYNLTQNNGVTTNLNGSVSISNTLTTGDNTSEISVSSGSYILTCYGSMTNNNPTWGNAGGSLQLKWRSTSNFPGGTFGDVDILFTRVTTGSITLTGDVTNTGKFEIFPDNDDRTTTIITDGYDISCGSLICGGSGATTRAGKLSITSTSSLTVSGDVTLYADDGTQENAIIVASGGTNAISVGGGWSIGSGAEFDAQNSTVTFNAASGSKTITSNGISFNNVIFNDGGGSTTWTLEDAFDVDGTFTLTDGIVDTKSGENNSITVDGNFSVNGGKLEYRVSTINLGANCTIANLGNILSGTGTINLTGSGTIENRAFSNAIYNLVQGNGVTTEFIHYTYCRNFTAGNGTSTVTKSASGSLNFRDATKSTLATNGATWTGSLEVASGTGNLEISAGDYGNAILNPGWNIITKAIGNIQFGTLNFGNATSHFDANGYDADFDSFQRSDLVSQTLSCGEGSVSFANAVDFSGTNGMTINLESATVSFGGNLTIGSTTTWNESTSTVEFNGSSTQSIQSDGESFNDVTITNKSGNAVTFTDAVDIQGTLTANANTGNILIKFDESGSHNVDTWSLSGSSPYYVQLRSESDGNQWDVTSSTSNTVSRVDVKDSNLSVATVTVSSGVDSGNNSSNWVFEIISGINDYDAGYNFGYNLGY